MTSTILLTFETTHAAMATAKALEKAGFKHYLIPVPREISAGCGMALRFEGKPLALALELAKEAGTPLDQVSAYELDPSERYLPYSGATWTH